jgi:catechol 2,3-dioxygenase-like lactoylglutathione lyase family enzyme
MSNYPRTFSHIGISVPDVEKAVQFYSAVMGWYQIMEPTVITEESDTPIGQMCIDVFGAGWGSFKIAHMSTGDRIVESKECLFENTTRVKNHTEWSM